MKVSESTVKRIWMHRLKHSQTIPIKKFGRPKKEIDEKFEQLIIETHKEQQLGARRLKEIIEFKSSIRLSHNKIHEVLLNHGLAKENEKKKKRRKPWIRYERKHSLTAVHLDLHTSKFNGKEVYVVMDDSSRYILSGREIDSATAENSINLMWDVIDNYGWIRNIEQAITDRAASFMQIRKTRTMRAKASSRFFSKRMV